MADAIINTNHNDMIISLTEADQTIKDIYREDGDLVVETNYKNDNASYVFHYVLDDNYKVLEYYCYDANGEKVSYSWVTEGNSYTYPEAIATAHESMSYTVPVDKPVQLALLEYKAYTDEACTTTWEETADDSGMYTDEVIYLKREGADTTEGTTEDSTPNP